jgi:hypothetical protein
LLPLRAVVLALVLCSCATQYAARTADVRAAYTAYDEAKALALLDQHFENRDPGIDKLLVLLDRGTVLHAAGRWEESKQVLAQADELSQQLDSISVTEEAGTMLANETVRVYRGEAFEKLMISVLQALNYAQLGDDEGARVEVRRCNERLEKMVTASDEPYEQLAIARYLSAILYEDQREWDSAAIDYLKSTELEPGLGVLAEPALRLAKKTERTDAYEQQLRLHPQLEHSPLGPDEGQLVVLIEAGQAPRKEESYRGKDSGYFAVPVYNVRPQPVPRATVQVGNTQLEAVTVTSLDTVAKKHLEDRIGKLLMKSLVSFGVKALLAAAVAGATKSSELGLMTFAALSLTQAADTRSWLSLPAQFQVARLRLKAGTQSFRVTAGGKTTEHVAEIVPGRVKLVVLRRY